MFRVDRASSRSWIRPEKPPCAGAVMDAGKWFVELADLPALLAFVASVGSDVIVGEDESLLIYDDYVE